MYWDSSINLPKILTPILNDSGRLGELKISKKTAHVRANCISCFMLNGNDRIAFPNCTKSEKFSQFLVDVMECNPQNRTYLVLDNFATYDAKKVKEKASEPNIELIYLLPYSPDLNPIELLWKNI